MSTETEYRLPRTVVPSRYLLTLVPDLTTASFTGSEKVDVDVLEPVREVVLNAIELVIDTVEMVSVASGKRLAATVSYDAASERATFRRPCPARILRSRSCTRR